MRETRLDVLVGKYILAGLTFVDATGFVLRREQFHGPVLSTSDESVVVYRADLDELATLPGDGLTFRPGAPGATYRLPLTGEIVARPDYLCSWLIPETVVGPDDGATEFAVAIPLAVRDAYAAPTSWKGAQ